MNELLAINCGNTSCVPYTSKIGNKSYISFTDTNHQPPQVNKQWFNLICSSCL